MRLELLKSRDQALITHLCLPNTLHSTWHRVRAQRRCSQLNWPNANCVVWLQKPSPCFLWFKILWHLWIHEMEENTLTCSSELVFRFINNQLFNWIPVWVSWITSTVTILQQQIAPQHQFRNIFSYSWNREVETRPCFTSGNRERKED